MSDGAVAPAGKASRTRSRSLPVTLTGLMLVLGISALDANIVGPAFPHILEEFGQVQHLAWVLIAFLLTATASTPLYGRLSDLYGRRPLFVTAIGLFLLGSVVSGFAGDMDGLIIGRAIQGLGAGGLTTLVQITMSDLVSPDRRASYQGLFGAVFVTASLLGPPAGGFLTQALSWRWIFYVNIPFGIAALILVLVSLVDLPRSEKVKLDILGAAVVILGAGAAMLALSWGGTLFPWRSPVILLLALAGALLLASIVPIERRSPAPIIPVPLFANRVFSIATILGALISTAVTCALTFVPLFLQLAAGLTPTQSGLMMTPTVAGLMVGLLGGGRAITRAGRYHGFVLAGAIGTTVALSALATAVWMGLGTWVLAILLGVLGLTLGAVMPGVTVALQNAIDPALIGAATACAAFFRGLGNAFAVAVAGAIVVGSSHVSPAMRAGAASALAAAPHSLHDGLSWTLTLAAILAATTIGLAWRLPNIPLRKPPPQPAASAKAESASPAPQTS